MREYLLTAALAATLCFLITPVIRIVAMKAGAFVNPRSRDIHTVIDRKSVV
jgi:UDP-GlcNAc:undecaprenyl-phosphate GlcNAc-1-phosphate transferase